jgi:hypothetical protein
MWVSSWVEVVSSGPLWGTQISSATIEELFSFLSLLVRKTNFSVENKNGFGELNKELDYVLVQNDNMLTDRWVQKFRRHALSPLPDAVEKKIRIACNIETSLVY